MMMLQRQVVPPWVVEHPEVFDPEFSLTADIQGLPVTDDSVSKMQGNSNILKLVLSVSTYYSLEYTCCNVCVCYPNTDAVSPMLGDGRTSEESSSVTTRERLSEPSLGDSGMCMRCACVARHRRWGVSRCSNFTLIRLGNIPDDPLLAETHYSQVREMREK